MEVTRRAVRFASGWVRAQVQEAGELAADALAATIQPFAQPIIEEHRAAGRPLVLATTTPYDLVKPLADALGFDAVVATRYGESDGALRRHARRRVRVGPREAAGHPARGRSRQGVDLAESWAYSDSFYDLPMLGAVKHPVAVNPDPRMLVVALLRRWPVVHLDVPAGVPKLLGVEPQKAVMAADPPGADALRALRHRRHRAHPRRRTGHRRRQPPQLLRPDRPRDGAGQARAARCASSARRRCSTLRSSASWPGPWAASASSAAPARTSRWPRPPLRWRWGRSWR